ncbi:MAG TPA: helix-turn-helix domain-containing protein [Solirubrobacteraceae bacterium]|jgi:AcrR family transcriptional regulator
MTIPAFSATEAPKATPDDWSTLDLDGKRERLLDAAAEVFARQGIDAPMSEVADAAGSGVASIYRRFASKRELLAALVVLRLDQIASAARAASRSRGDSWSALTRMLHQLVERQAADDFLGEARAAVASHPDVVAATERATDALDRVLAQARDEGRLRSDATTLDLRLLFAATRAARQVEPENWPRMLELMIDALDSQPGRR